MKPKAYPRKGQKVTMENFKYTLRIPQAMEKQIHASGEYRKRENRNAP